MTVQRMRKIYGMVNDKYKTVRERRKDVEHSDDRTGAETVESQRLFQKTIKEKSKFIRYHEKTWTSDKTPVKTQIKVHTIFTKIGRCEGDFRQL